MEYQCVAKSSDLRVRCLPVGACLQLRILYAPVGDLGIRAGSQRIAVSDSLPSPLVNQISQILQVLGFLACFYVQGGDDIRGGALASGSDCSSEWEAS